MVEQYKQSGKSILVFARETGIEQSVFYRWIKRYEQQLHLSGSGTPDETCLVKELEVIKKEVVSLRRSVDTLRGIMEKVFHDRYLPESFEEIGNADCSLAAQ